MKDFFRQCLEDLEAKTGLRQLYWLQQNPDDERQVNIVLDSMVIVSREFSYIPEEDQRRIITEMIVKDQDYDSLNSRVIYKWLNQRRDHYWINGKADEEIPRVVHTAEQEENIRKISSEWLAKLSGNFTPEYKGLADEIKRITAEDEERAEGRRAALRERRGEDPRQEKIRAYVKQMGKWIEVLPKNVYDIEGLKVPGDTEDEAKEIFMMALM